MPAALRMRVPSATASGKEKALLPISSGKAQDIRKLLNLDVCLVIA